MGKTYVQHFFGHRMAHFSATLAVAGSGDSIRFSSLEFPTLPPIGIWVPPIFEPSQAFLLGSLDFIANRLGVLHLCEEALVPAPVGGVPSIDSETHDFDDAASALHSEQTLCSNPAVSNVHVVIYLLFSIFCDYPKGPRCPRHDRNTTGSPMASRLPRTRTLGGSEGCRLKASRPLVGFRWLMTI